MSCKNIAFKKFIKKNSYNYSWYNITIIMTIIGIGFGCIENVAFSINSGIISMIIKGISIGHAGYGFIMGWLYGKMMNSGKKIYGVLSYIIPWLLHGLYDFGLSQELLDINDSFAFISVSLEIVCIIFVFLIIRFVRKRNNSETYNKPLVKAPN